MSFRTYQQRFMCLAAAAALSLLAARAGTAAPLTISDTPLFLTTGVQPNLIMAIDDSGSMDFEVLLRGNDGAAWWRTGVSGNCTTTLDNNSFVGCIADGTTDNLAAGQLNFNNAGNASATWKKYSYLFPNGSGGNTSDQRRLADATNDHFAIPPLADYAWSRSPEHNAAYFNPATTYSPWPNGGGFTFNNATPTAAEFDPVFDGAGTINLTRDFAGNAGVDTTTSCDSTTNGIAANFYFRVYTGMVIPAGTCMRVSSRPNWETVRTGGTCTVGTVNGCQMTRAGSDVTYSLGSGSSVAIRYFPATFYLSDANPPPVSFGYTATAPLVGKAPGDTTTPTLRRYEIKLANFGGDTAKYDAAMQNFANWFSYFRKRHQALRSGLGQAFLTLQATRVGGFTINSATAGAPDVTMGDIGTTSVRDALYTNFYQNWVRSGGTPNRTAVANMIRNFKRTNSGAPITHSCQRNFGMLFTDGFSNPPAAGDGIPTGNIDGGQGAPYQDSTSNTMADATMDAYANSLRTDLPQGKVKVPTACSDSGHDPRLDCNTDPHMNFYAITLGTRGLQFNPDNPVDPYVTTPTWPTSFPARHPSAVDDIWHATINGRGQLLNAKSSSELADKLGAVLRSIADAEGSASSAAVNSGSINAESRIFQASFDSKDWSGKLEAFQINTDGTLGGMTAATIPAAGSRQIFTINSDGTAVRFLWGSLDATRRAQLDATADATTGANLVNYLRGDQSRETPTGPYRARKNTVLGDIINSAPTFVGAPSARYSDTLESKRYSDFRLAHVDRPHMVYVGANDGMLHAFHSEDDGPVSSRPVTEQFAYVPGVVLKNMKELSDPAYTHQYYVDGTPTTRDAFVSGDWRTMLVAGLNKGGQAIYALDVTDPMTIQEASANSVLHWEFSDANDRDLGFTFSRPFIARMNNGRWAAIFGNGYNNTAADGIVSTTGNAVLYVVDLEDGTLLRKIDTLFGTTRDPKGLSRPNGMSTPAVLDVDGNGNVDIGYAGDLFGNLWKFDFSSNDPAQWGVAYGGGAPVPLITATDANGRAQPITSRPNVNKGPDGIGYVVLFGTGKYFETGDGDVGTLTPQSFYGVLDPNTMSDTTDTISSRALLVQQTITNEYMNATFGSGTPEDPQVSANVRVTSNNVVSPTQRGWYIDLVSPSGFQGEIQVTDSAIRFTNVIFTTLIPSADPCESGGTSWLMVMNLFTGSRLEISAADINSNGKFDDFINGQPITGIQSTNGIQPRPGLIAGDPGDDGGGGDGGTGCEFAVLPGTGGETATVCLPPGVRSIGRQSWRQVR